MMMKNRFKQVLFGVFLGLLTLASADDAAYGVMFLGDIHWDAKEYHPD